MSWQLADQGASVAVTLTPRCSPLLRAPSGTRGTRLHQLGDPGSITLIAPMIAVITLATAAIRFIPWVMAVARDARVRTSHLHGCAWSL